MPQYKFYRQTEKLDEVIIAKHDELKDWRPDPKAYFLIRVNPAKKIIEAALVTYDHTIRKKIVGKYAVEIHNTIIRHKLLTKPEHAAYLGKELYKAELALKYGAVYRQDFPLIIKELKEAVKLGKQS